MQPTNQVRSLEWPIPVEIPARVLAELAGDADVLDGGGSQRCRAARTGRVGPRPHDPPRQPGATPGTARPVPLLRDSGCNVGYDRCELHHLLWWRHGGRTDLDNLIPICTKHHGKVHHDGWIIELGPNRELTLRLPDGTVRSTGPPTIRAA